MSYLHTRMPWILLIIALVGDFAVPYSLAIFYPGYSHRKQVMSVLGNPKSPVAKVYNIWLIILGILICFSSIKVYMVYQRVSNFYAGTILIIMVLFGIGAGVLSGLFSVDETKDMESRASKIHGIGAGIGFMLLTFIPLIIGLLSFKVSNRIFGLFSILLFIVSVFFFVLFVMSEREDYENSVIGQTGLWQRLLLASMYMPLFLVACYNILSTQV